jgi:hypothetical protein
MSKTYIFISHVEHDHLLEVADILGVRCLLRRRAHAARTRCGPGAAAMPRRARAHDAHAHLSSSAARARAPHRRRTAARLLRGLRAPGEGHAGADARPAAPPQTHANPDVSYCGVMPLHLACEEGFADLAAYLMHWGASTTALDGSRKTPLQHAQARLKAKKTKDCPQAAKIVKCVRGARKGERARRGCASGGAWRVTWGRAALRCAALRAGC